MLWNMNVASYLTLFSLIYKSFFKSSLNMSYKTTIQKVLVEVIKEGVRLSAHLVKRV